MKTYDAESPQWAPCPQIETTDPVEGGPGGVANRPSEVLADRTALLARLASAAAFKTCY